MAPSPRRSGALRPLRALLTLTVIGNVLFLLVTPAHWVRSWRAPLEFWAPLDALKDPAPDPLQPAFTTKVGHADNHVLVTVLDPTPAQTTLEIIAMGAVSAVAWLVIAILARRIVTSALHTDPFTTTTADRLRGLGIVILAAGGLAGLIRLAASYALFHSVFPSSTYQGDLIDLSLWWLPLGLAVLAFAAVVRHACALRAELDEVI
ncbi:DUF2975 domain-containing protein [Actinoplanes sp. NPDC020271]|uniref:DUF2975 domain-containing protein n=1 Tax=Actinoplanes sp. NPDC020271 TaxID=3363896 RepID=UPI0037ABD064